jgi:serine/threonine-protein kinase
MMLKSDSKEIQKQSLIRQTLSLQTVEEIVQRLGWFSLFCAIIAAFLAVLERRLQPNLFEFTRSQVAYLSWIGIVFISLLMTMICKLRLLSPAVTLNLGLVYEVFVAFGLSVSETAVSLAQNLPVVGISRLVPWIVITGVLIPNKPRTKLVVALLSASTWPLAYLASIHALKFQSLPMSHLLAWVYVPYTMAFLIYFIAKRIYVLTTDADNARELGSYQLISQIGTGGMGEVWRAKHRMLARDAAIKVIRNDLVGEPGYRSETRRQRFKREAQVIASLQSPHTVHLFDFGISQDGSFYYVMELLDGISLQAIVEKFGPVPAARLIYMMQQTCDSLEEAHSLGLVHRDIKPSNIFVCKMGLEYDFIKVLDFGLVKDVNNSGRLTREGASVGTPEYMAPETVMGEDNIDHRVDIYGIGCMAYFALTGSEVFPGETLGGTAVAHVLNPPVPPSQRTKEPIPSKLEQIILLCLAKEPKDRIQTVREVRDLLKGIAIPEWTQHDAFSWWKAYLPDSSSRRISLQNSNVGTISFENGTAKE